MCLTFQVAYVVRLYGFKPENPKKTYKPHVHTTMLYVQLTPLPNLGTTNTDASLAAAFASQRHLPYYLLDGILPVVVSSHVLL